MFGVNEQEEVSNSLSCDVVFLQRYVTTAAGSIGETFSGNEVASVSIRISNTGHYSVPVVPASYRVTLRRRLERK